MRTLKLHFPDQALPTLDTFLKQTRRPLFRRAQAVREVVQGQRLQTVSDSLHFTYARCASGSSLRQPGSPRLGEIAPPRSPTQRDLRAGAPP